MSHADVLFPDSTKRIEELDALRGLAIFLVVIGHSLLGLINANIIPLHFAPKLALLFLYSFHVPLLFFVSGFVQKTKHLSLGDFSLSQLKWVFAPYVIWSCLLVAVQAALPSAANAPVDVHALSRILWSPISLFWFLYALFIIRTLDFCGSRFVRDEVKTAAVLMCLGGTGVTVLDIFNCPFGLGEQILICLFFYALGKMLSCIAKKRLDFFDWIQRGKGSWAIVMLLSFGLLFFIANLYVQSYTNDHRALFEFQRGILFTGTLGILASIIAVSFIQRSFVYRVLCLMGLYSMVIYVQHVFWGAGIRSLLGRAGVDNDALELAVIVGVSIAGAILWQKIADRLGVSKFFGIRPMAKPERT